MRVRNGGLKGNTVARARGVRCSVVILDLMRRCSGNREGELTRVM